MMLKRRSFTLIELMVVVAVIGILAAMLVPGVSNLIEKARIARAESELKNFQTACAAVYADVGYYPRDVGPNTDPGLVSIARVPASLRSNWNGPYLRRWPLNPWGGRYDYQGWNYAPFNFDGTAGNENLISIYDFPQPTIQSKIDSELDDGSATSGTIRYGGSVLHYYIGEGIRW